MISSRRSIGLVFFCSLIAGAQGRTVAITVDDLPLAGGDSGEVAEVVNGKLLKAFQARHIPVTGFVIQQRVESLKSGNRILREWIDKGFDLGNHTFSHPDINDLSIEEIERQIVRGEAAIGPLMKTKGKALGFFRFPINHTGDTAVKHNAVAAFLAQRGYSVATCTIDNSDYLFNEAYLKMVAKHDSASAKRLRVEYLAYTSTEINYYAGLNKPVLGYEPPQVMLLHDSRLNADVIGQVLDVFVEKGYRFVPLGTAQADAAYLIPDTYLTAFGPMWGYRWARERHVTYNGRLEKEPPQWILDYGK